MLCLLIFLRSSSSARKEEVYECSSIELLHEFATVFPAEQPRILTMPSSNHFIDLLPDPQPVFQAPYCLSAFEEEDESL